MTDITIPNEALAAAVNAANESDPYYVSRTQIEDAIIAALNAWPHGEIGQLPPAEGTFIILPLPTKETDA